MEGIQKLKRFILISVLLFVILFLILIWWIFQFSSQQKEQINIPVTPRPTFIQFPSPGVGQEEYPLSNTGGKDEPLPWDETMRLNETFELRKIIPYKQPGFDIEYDIKRRKFIVSLEAPYDVNQTLFDKWLKENGFTHIIQNDFICGQL